jgi:DNA-directed RNA polymerase subunit RPC12/RpoP
MALTIQDKLEFIKTTKKDTERFTESFSAGDTFYFSGIYRCTKCGREIAANKDDSPLPPHYRNSDCKSPNWQLLLEAQN